MANEKLIYASAARKAILKADPKLAYCIDSIPGVDAEPVVRCKDCKHFTAGYCCRDIKGRSQMHYMGEDAFCSYGERREGE
jgi:hypothetical protein